MVVKAGSSSSSFIPSKVLTITIISHHLHNILISPSVAQAFREIQLELYSILKVYSDRIGYLLMGSS